MYDYSDATTAASKPLMLEAYTTFVLIPYITSMLIVEDLHTDIEGGWEAMQLGIECGKRVNSLQNPDPMLDGVFAANEERRLKDLDSGQQTKDAGHAKKGKENVPPTVCLYLFRDRHETHSQLTLGPGKEGQDQGPEARCSDNSMHHKVDHEWLPWGEPPCSFCSVNQ